MNQTDSSDVMLCYMNVKKDIFDYEDINLDYKYKFYVEINKNTIPWEYTLKVKETDLYNIPKKFWGNTISAVNVVVGKNASGKSTLLRFIRDNIRKGITSLSGEGVMYIVKVGTTYVYNSNYRNVILDESIQQVGINLMNFDTYFSNHSSYGSYGNNIFWRGMVFFSNYYGSTAITQNDHFVVDSSKDRCVYDLKQKNEMQSESFSLQTLYLQRQYLKILEFSEDSVFQQLAKSTKSTIPDLIRFSVDSNIFIINSKYQRFKKQQKDFDLDNNVFHDLVEEPEIQFVKAVNNFAITLVFVLHEDKRIDDVSFDMFLEKVDECNNNNMESILDYTLSLIKKFNIDEWIPILDFFNTDTNRFEISAQTEDSFIFEITQDNQKRIKDLISQMPQNPFCTYDFVYKSESSKGLYSSGEESKLSLLVGLYSSYKKILDIDGFSNNLILLLDEVDAYYHPEFQIKMVKELIEMVSWIFDGFKVQIIFATNTPLELSDIPNQSIIYLDKGKVQESMNNEKTFGANVCTLLNNSFFVNSVTGDFSRDKINQVISFLNSDMVNDAEMDKEEAKYIISIIGEPIIKNKLESMYYERFPEDEDTRKQKLRMCKEKAKKMRKMIHIESMKADEQLKKELESLLQGIEDM